MATFGADMSDTGAIVGSVGASETGGGGAVDDGCGCTGADAVGLSFILSVPEAGLADVSGPSAKLFFCFLLGKHMDAGKDQHKWALRALHCAECGTVWRIPHVVVLIAVESILGERRQIG